jgi:hypothetical protein
MAIRGSGGASPPITPQEAPDWFQNFGADTTEVIRELLRRIADLEGRLKAANL